MRSPVSGRLVLVAAKPGEEATIVLRDLMTKRGT